MKKFIVVFAIAVAMSVVGCGRQSQPNAPVKDLTELSRKDFNAFLSEWSAAPLVYMVLADPNSQPPPISATNPLPLFTSEELARSYVEKTPYILKGDGNIMPAYLSSLADIPYRHVVLNPGSTSEKVLTQEEANRLIEEAKKARKSQQENPQY
jgi:hypothetical protein